MYDVNNETAAKRDEEDDDDKDTDNHNKNTVTVATGKQVWKCMTHAC